MSFKDISAKLKAAREDKAPTTSDHAHAFNHDEAYRIRAKMLGVLLCDARMAAARSISDCAHMLRIEPSLLEAWEYGDAVPSLPQLELLASYLDVPVSHFWSMETITAQRRSLVDAQEEYMKLRHRMIGALLRQAREEANLTLDSLAGTVYLSPDLLQAYELGDHPIPMHELAMIASAIHKNTSYFLESSSQIGELLATRENWKHFNNLPEDLRQFAANPLNIGFIEIALAFSQMPNDKLKRIAVSMLDITGY
ncbi:MAG: hypothetical protein MUF87_19490 [Anaerolineae bacterium]|jgi:transcriptional regulator with XRE-family HTH domain|nr:hypothetical protein [Anaerolineae bacterium]